MKPPIELENFYLLRSSVLRTTQLEDRPEPQQLELGFHYDVSRNQEDPHRFMLDFRMKSLPQKDRPDIYKVDFQILGFFAFPKDTVEDNMQYLIRVNGCTILYGILRGIVANVTGTFPEGPLPLPTVMMHDVVNSVERSRNTKPVESVEKRAATQKTTTCLKKRTKASKKSK